MKAVFSGKKGETEAFAYLVKKGYKIVGANYHSRYGEIDLIARQKNLVVFVEVKLRKSRDFANAMEFVDYKKRQKIITTAQLWLTANDPQSKLQPRFDVIEIYFSNGQNNRIELNHIENAF